MIMRFSTELNIMKKNNIQVIGTGLSPILLLICCKFRILTSKIYHFYYRFPNERGLAVWKVFARIRQDVYTRLFVVTCLFSI